MRTWIPLTLYGARPWAIIGSGTVLAIDAVLQLHRARGKWRRESPP
jgi:hypothetical protein